MSKKNRRIHSNSKQMMQKAREIIATADGPVNADELAEQLLPYFTAKNTAEDFKFKYFRKNVGKACRDSGLWGDGHGNYYDMSNTYTTIEVCDRLIKFATDRANNSNLAVSRMSEEYKRRKIMEMAFKSVDTVFDKFDFGENDRLDKDGNSNPPPTRESVKEELTRRFEQAT